MQTIDLFTVLQNSQRSDDASVQKQAEADLQRIKQENPGQYVCSLASELGKEDRPATTRSLAGLALKNAIDIRLNNDNAQIWLGLSPDARTEVKTIVFRTLASPTAEARWSSTQALAKIALIELPQTMWPELLPSLVSGLAQPQEYLRESVLKAIGYICEEIHPDVLAPESSAILNGICTGLSPSETSVSVKIAACDALYNSLEFITTNMDQAEHRKYLMDQVMSAAQHQDTKVQTKSLMCLNKIAGFYYEKLNEHMEKLFELTCNAIRSQSDEVAKQGIEFWSTIAAVEEEFHEEAREAAEQNRPPEVASAEYTRRVLPWIVPLILQALTRVEEYEEEEEWTVALSAATCLEHLSNCVTDDIVEHVIPFLSQNINSQEWQYRDASVMAFGSIMDGPSGSKLEPVISQGIPALFKLLKDDSISVKDSAVWALGQICLFHSDSVKDKWLPTLMDAIYYSLSQEARVANNACWALYNLAESFEGLRDQPSHALSPYIVRSIRELLQCSSRPDADVSNLRISAYETLNNIILFSAEDSLPTISELVNPLIERMKATFGQAGLTSADREEIFDLQSHLCGLFHAICTRLRGSVRPYADSLMMCFLEVLKYPHKTVFEEVLMAVGALATAIGAEFARYMDAFGPHLMNGLSTGGPVRVLTLAIGAAGDVCRALDRAFVPYLPTFYAATVALLRDANTDPFTRPMLLSILGDYALVCGGAFEQYIPETIELLNAAKQINISNPEDEDQILWVNSLRQAVFDVYTGLLQGLKPEKKGLLLQPYIDNMFVYIVNVANDKYRNDDVLAAAINLIGDVGSVLGATVSTYLQNKAIDDLVKKGRSSHDADVEEAAKWARSVISKIRHVR
ncbi:hypothetical protein P9112_012005 [Eukaryota sp. TZLM1-RC]